jgi:hypothetical protein
MFISLSTFLSMDSGNPYVDLNLFYPDIPRTCHKTHSSFTLFKFYPSARFFLRITLLMHKLLKNIKRAHKNNILPFVSNSILMN